MISGDAAYRALMDGISLVVGDIVKSESARLESQLVEFKKEYAGHHDLQGRVSALERSVQTPSKILNDVKFVVASHLSEIVPALEGRMERNLHKVVGDAFADFGAKLRRDLDYALNMHAAKGQSLHC